MTITIHITESKAANGVKHRSVNISVMCVAACRREDVEAALKVHGFQPDRILPGFTRSFEQWVEHPGGRHYELFITEQTPEPKPEPKKEQPVVETTEE